MKQKNNNNSNILHILYGFLGFSALMLSTNPAFANADLSDIGRWITASLTNTPALISGFSYLMGILFSTIAVLKTKGHVEDSRSTKLWEPMAYGLTGGMFLTMPTIYEMVLNTIDPVQAGFGAGNNMITNASGVLGGLNIPFLQETFSEIMENITNSVEDIPTYIGNLSYLLGLIILMSAVFTIREHIEDPKNVSTRQYVRKFLLAGALFTLPTIMTALWQTVSGGNDGNGIAAVQMTAVMGGINNQSGVGCLAGGGLSGIIAALVNGQHLGLAICNVFRATQGFPAFLTGIAYLFGTILTVWGLMKLNDHVQDPSRTQLWDPLSKLLVAGLMFALPLVVTIAYNTVASFSIPGERLNTGFLDGGIAPGGGLDSMLVSLMQSVFGPMNTIIVWFGLMAGFIFVFIGISRLLKSQQDGAKGPTGIGTMMTFITGGLLLSFSPFVASVSTSVFGDRVSETEGILVYTAGITDLTHIHAVIAAVTRFVMIIGIISIMRGVFIVRSISEGSGQASMMAGLTHIIGGGIAVNLGPAINYLSGSLGLTGLGVGVAFN